MKPGSRRCLAAFGLGCALLFAVPGAGVAAPPDDSPEHLLERAAQASVAARPAEAESLATVARLALEAAAHPDTALLARAWCEVAHAWRMRHITTSDEGLKAALKSVELFAATPDAPDSLVNLARDAAGWYCSVFGRSAEGARHFRAAADLARRNSAGWGGKSLSVSLYLLGWSFTNSGANDSALVVLHEALRLRQEMNNPKDTLPGDIYSFIGVAEEQKGEVERAEAAYEAAVRLAEAAAGLGSGTSQVAISRAAAFEFRRGDLARAFDYYQRALDRLLAVSPNEPDVDLFRIAVAQVLEQLGDARRAADIFSDALPRYEAHMGSASQSVLYAWISYASACQKLGENDRALDMFARLRSRLEADSARSESLPLVVVLSNEAQLMSFSAPSDSALHLAERAVALNRSQPGASPLQNLNGLCVQLLIHAQRGRWAEVDRLDAELTRELAGFPSAGNLETDQVWVTRSRAAALRGRTADAVAAAAEGARQARERLATNVRALSDRQALLLSSTLSPALDQLLKTGARFDTSSLRLGWNEIVRTRGLVRDEISRRRLPPALSADSALVAAHRAWVQAERQLAQFQVSSAASPRDAALDSTLTALRADVDDHERRLVRLFPTGLPGASPPVDLAAVLSRIGPGQALVSFCRAPGADDARHLLAFVARGGTSALSCVDLGRVDDLAPLVADWRGALGEPDAARRSERRCRALGARVRTCLWDPLLRLTGVVRDLYLIPEAPVDGLAWAALPLDGGRYLVEAGPLIHTLDAERDIIPDPAARRGNGLLAVGDVDYDQGGSAPPHGDPTPATPSPLRRGLPGGCDGLAARHFIALPGTGAELRDVVAAWSRGVEAAEVATPLAGAAASEAAFKRLCVGRLVLHLATHGVSLSDTCDAPPRGMRGVGGVAPIEPEGTPSGAVAKRRAARRPPDKTTGPAEPGRASPWLGREVMLALAGANHAREGAGDENEGLLTAEEVTTLDLRGVEWVVLSACHSAAGEAWSGQGVLGMQRAFHLAGARSVIASQWSVEDAATREWMRDLYEARSRGVRDAADAMRSACRAVIEARRTARRSVHPFYWAAFTLSGQ